MQARDLRNLHAGKKFEFVTRNGRTNDHSDKLGVHTMFGECCFEKTAAIFDHLLIDLLRNAAVEHLERWQLPVDLAFLWKRHGELLGLRRRHIAGWNMDIEFVSNGIIVGTGDKQQRVVIERISGFAFGVDEFGEHWLGIVVPCVPTD